MRKPLQGTGKPEELLLWGFWVQDISPKEAERDQGCRMVPSS